jgi:hypothetical protein
MRGCFAAVTAPKEPLRILIARGTPLNATIEAYRTFSVSH